MTDRIRCEEHVSVFKNKWVEVFFDKVEADDPRIKRYTCIVESGGRPGVACLPIYKNEIGLIRTFRYPIRREVWEIPRGFGESGAEAENMRRELAEETTLDQYDLIEMGRMCPNSGLLASEVHLFAAVTTERSSEGKPRDQEVIEFRWFGISRVSEMIREGEMCDGFTLVTILRALHEGYLPDLIDEVGLHSRRP
jgi:ADP-ribose pyrophosphatase